ncbi:MAG TPA: DnaJ domain-containing protein [Actinomycetota bacterium]|jgi:curved DNA-binding protein CbpA
MSDHGIDYYAVLGVPPDCDQKTLRQAYRKFVLELHPDRRPGDPEAPARFHQVQEAFEILSSPERRAEYDALREQSPEPLDDSESDVWEEDWEADPAKKTAKADESLRREETEVPQHGRPNFWKDDEIPQDGRPGFWDDP